jgi:hypothetical protein
MKEIQQLLAEKEGFLETIGITPGKQAAISDQKGLCDTHFQQN